MEKKTKHFTFICNLLGLVAFAMASMASTSSKDAMDFHEGFREGYRAVTGYDIGQTEAVSDTIVADMPLVAISNEVQTIN